MLRKTWVFFALTYAISWLLWLPSVLRSNGLANLPEIVGLAGMFAVLGPTIAAFILVGRESGRAGMRRLLRRAIETGFKKRWWIPTLLLFPIIGLLTTGILMLMGIETAVWTPPTLLTAIGTAVFILLFGGGLEEFGWRGYALDRLQTGQNAIAASLVLGFFWGLWHLPLFFIDTSVQAQAAIPIWEFVLQQKLLAVFYTWLYNNTRGTLLVAILFHTIGNTSAALLPPYFGTEIGRWVNFILLAITALLVAITWGWRTLNRGQTVPQPSLHQPSA